MPNDITNELTAPKTVLDSLRSSESELDFETVVPMPEILKGSPHSGITQWAEIAMGVINLKTLSASTPDPVAAFQRQDYGAASRRIAQLNAVRQMREGPYPKDWSDEDFEQLIQCMRGLKQYGHTSWYEWSIAEWGTKWNAYEVNRVNDTTIRFQTAWSAPLKWLARLAEKFPNERIAIRWADEDFGNNVGAITINEDGSVSGDKIENDSREAHQLAMELKYGGIVPEYMRAEPDGKYSYVED
jgi:hypothetical protein